MVNDSTSGMAWSLLWTMVCALVVVRRLRPRKSGGCGQDGDDALAMAVTWLATVFGLVPLGAFALYVTVKLPVQAPSLAGVATLYAALGIATMPRGKAPLLQQLLPLDVIVLLARKRGLVVGASLAVSVLYFLRFGGPLSQFHCIREAAFIAWGSNFNDADLLRGNVGDARLGNAAVMAGGIAWFHGQRYVHAALAFMLAAGGWLVGKQCGKRGRWGWLSLATVALNPMLLAIPMVEENVLATGFAVPVVALALSRRPPWLFTGLLFGLVFSMRHPFALAFPGLFYLAWRDDSRRAWLWLLAGAALGSSISHAHHILAFGSPFAFESNAQFAPLPYDILGWHVKWRGMANWPLHDQLIRTPHNPFPMLVAWPLHLADHVGMALFSLMLLGFMAVWKRNRKHAVFLCLWWLPMYAAIAVQEAWDHPNKMGVLAIGAPVFAAWTAHGAAAVFRRDFRPVVAWGALLLACFAALTAVRGWDVPADQRYFRGYHRVPIESKAWLEAARDEATDIAIWPDFRRVHRYGEMLNPAKLDDRENYTVWGWFDGQILPPDKPITVEIDLSASPWRQKELLRISRDKPHIDLVGKPGMIMATVPVSWDDQPLTVVATRGPRLGHIEFAFTDFRDREPHCRMGRDPCHCDYFDTYEHGSAANTCRGLTDLGVIKADKIRVRTTMRAISVTGLISDIGHVSLLWKVRLLSQTTEHEGPYLYWHD